MIESDVGGLVDRRHSVFRLHVFVKVLQLVEPGDIFLLRWTQGLHFVGTLVLVGAEVFELRWAGIIDLLVWAALWPLALENLVDALTDLAKCISQTSKWVALHQLCPRLGWSHSLCTRGAGTFLSLRLIYSLGRFRDPRTSSVVSMLEQNDLSEQTYCSCVGCS